MVQFLRLTSNFKKQDVHGDCLYSSMDISLSLVIAFSVTTLDEAGNRQYGFCLFV